MKSLFLIVVMLAFFLSGCSNEYSFVEPDSEGLLEGTTALSQSLVDLIEGIYVVESGNSSIGDKAVIKFSNEYATIFCGGRVDYLLLKHGKAESTIVFEGYSRVAENILTGAVNLIIDEENLAELLLGNDVNLTIRGVFQRPTVNSEVTKRVELVLKKERALGPESFYVVAHRGGGRNSDYLNVSENSIAMIKFSEALGANAVELDVRLSRDNVPILFHDAEFTSRAIEGDFLVGEVSKYTFKHIRAFGRLKFGETIPTLEEALEAIVMQTKHKLVWLDLKEPSVLDSALPIIEKYKLKAEQEGRTLKIAVGIVDNATRDQLLQIAEVTRPPAICELSTNEALRIKAAFWAPRWTNGTMKNEVALMHEQNIEVIPWTMDDRIFIRKYLQETAFDGILTNYPVIAAYEYWTK